MQHRAFFPPPPGAQLHFHPIRSCRLSLTRDRKPTVEFVKRFDFYSNFLLELLTCWGILDTISGNRINICPNDSFKTRVGQTLAKLTQILVARGQFSVQFINQASLKLFAFEQAALQ
jgi:hypothetical protein